MYSQYTKDQVRAFVTRFGSIIVPAITDSGLFFPTVIGQLTMESDWGQSDLSAKYKNYAGVKNTGSLYSSGKVALDTTEVINGNEISVKAYFATYDDFKSFINDYVRVLALSQYVAAGVYTATSPYNQILAIGQGGYSTRDPQTYADNAKGRIDACIDQFPWGKISSGASNPTAPAGNTLSLGVEAIMNSIKGTISSSIGKP